MKKLKHQTVSELTETKQQFFAISIIIFIGTAAFLLVSLATSSILAIVALLISPWFGLLGIAFFLLMAATKQELRLREYVDGKK